MPTARSSPRGRLVSIALLAAVTLSSTACNSSGGEAAAPPEQPPPEVTLGAVQIVPAAEGGVSVPIGTAVQFRAVGTYSDGSTADLTSAVTWSSSDAAAATIDGGGLVTPIAPGATVVGALEPETGLEASVSVSIVPAALAVLEIAPLDPTVLVGMTLQLQARGTFADDTDADVTGNVAWTSSDDAVATVSAGGLVTAVAVGTAIVTATDPVSGATAAITLGVTDVPAALSYVILSRGSVRGGDALTGTVVLTSYTDQPVAIALSSGDPRVTVPAEVTVPAGADRASFAVTTTAVERRVRVLVYATDGTATKSASLNVRAPKRP